MCDIHEANAKLQGGRKAGFGVARGRHQPPSRIPLDLIPGFYRILPPQPYERRRQFAQRAARNFRGVGRGRSASPPGPMASRAQESRRSRRAQFPADRLRRSPQLSSVGRFARFGLRLIQAPGLRSRVSSRTIPPTRTRRILPLGAPLATRFLATSFLATLLLAQPSPDRLIASRASSLPNREVVQPSHAPRLPVARRTFQLLCTRARPAHPQPFQNLAKQPRCFCHFAARIAIARPADAIELFPRCVLESQRAKSTSPRGALLHARQRRLATHRRRAAS